MTDDLMVEKLSSIRMFQNVLTKFGDILTYA